MQLIALQKLTSSGLFVLLPQYVHLGRWFCWGCVCRTRNQCTAGVMVEEVARFFDPWGADAPQQQAQPQGEAIGAR